MGLLPRRQSQATSQIDQIRQMLGGDPVGYAEHMLSTNPDFADFVRRSQGRPIEDVARDAAQASGADYGMMNMVMGMARSLLR